MDQVKQRLIRAMWMALAVIFLIENWLWDHVRDGLRALAHLIGLERFDPWLRGVVSKLSPPMTLVLFVIPGAMIFPVKLVALGLLASGYIISGIVAIFAAKAFALGVMAVLFDICRDKLMQMQWFCRFYSLMLSINAWAHNLIAPFRRRLSEIIAGLRERLAPLVRRQAQTGRLSIARQLSRIRAWAARIVEKKDQRDGV
jgi:hypothetical protein